MFLGLLVAFYIQRQDIIQWQLIQKKTSLLCKQWYENYDNNIMLKDLLTKSCIQHIYISDKEYKNYHGFTIR